MKQLNNTENVPKQTWWVITASQLLTMRATKGEMMAYGGFFALLDSVRPYCDYSNPHWRH